MNTLHLRARSVVVGGRGGVLVALALALAVAGCTSTMSLGAAGTPDGGDATAITSSDAGDVQPDRAPDVAADTAPDVVTDTGPDVATDAHMDQDGDGGQNCVDNGITYHSGDVVLRPGCQLSCVCTDGVVGACSGIPCPVDGSVVFDPIPVATITRGVTASPEVQVFIDNRGAAQRSVSPSTILPTPPLPRTFPPGSPEVTLFLYHLQRVGVLTGLTVACPDALSSVVTVRLLSGSGVTSSDFACPLINPTPDQVALVHDTYVLLGVDEGNDSINAQTCTTSGGQIANNLCCSGAGNFPDSCAVGACSCAPTNLQVVDTCACPNDGCFIPSVGCVGPANVCTVGANQTCNDNPTINSIHGTCVTGGHCKCGLGTTLLASGKCS